MSSPTIAYDTEQPPSTPLDPPNMDEIIQRKHPYKRLLHLEFPRRIQLPLTCLSIGLSALQSNGVYCWPTYGPVVGRMLDLTGSEVQTIVVAGSLVAAILSGFGYLSFATILQNSTPDTPHIHLYLTAAFFCVGAGVVGSYFASLTCASLSFPAYPTLSLSVPLSLVGLSSLYLSSFSYIPAFLLPDPPHELNAPKFLYFLGFLTFAVNIFSALFMRIIPPSLKIALPTDEEREREGTVADRLHINLDEHTPLLIGGIEAARYEVEEQEAGKNVNWTVVGLLRSLNSFWVFGIIMLLALGPSETVISSMGSILTSLLPDPLSSPLSILLKPIESLNALSLRNKHVQILSLTSTIFRLLTGITADYLCPAPIAVPNPKYKPDDVEESPEPEHLWVSNRQVLVYRCMFAAGCSLVLGLVYGYGAGLLADEGGLWGLSAGTGAMSGALFTLTPAIVSAHFGPRHFGLAWGMISYFPALGSVIFSYLYALLSDSTAQSLDTSSLYLTKSRADEALICYGARCFQTTLWVGMGCSVVGAVGLGLLSRRWRV